MTGRIKTENYRLVLNVKAATEDEAREISSSIIVGRERILRIICLHWSPPKGRAEKKTPETPFTTEAEYRSDTW